MTRRVQIYKMKTVITIIYFYAFLIFSCTGNGNGTENQSRINQKDALEIESQIFDDTIKPQEQKYTVFEIDTIPDITQKLVTSPTFIKKRLEKLIGKSMKAKCDSIGVKYPPKFVLFRSFKLEKEFEIWVGDTQKDSLKLLAILPVCAVDNQPSPKLQRGDGKTPEGFYNCDLLYGSSYSFMWINLNRDKISNFGNVGNGCSSFKICTDYPHSIDRRRTQKNVGNSTSTGGEICIHGNCVTAGCISFENENFLPVFLAASHHNKTAYGKIKIHIFPFRFTEENKTYFSKNAYSEMKKDDLIKFWDELEKGYNLFEKTRKALNVSYSGENYNYKQF